MAYPCNMLRLSNGSLRLEDTIESTTNTRDGHKLTDTAYKRMNVSLTNGLLQQHRLEWTAPA